MKNLVVSSLIALASTVAFAGASVAEEIHIPVAGKDARTLHIEIVKAAHRVCAEASADLFAPVSEDQCLIATVAKATAQAKAAQTSVVASAGQTANRGER